MTRRRSSGTARRSKRCSVCRSPPRPTRSQRVRRMHSAKRVVSSTRSHTWFQEPTRLRCCRIPRWIWRRNSSYSCNSASTLPVVLARRRLKRQLKILKWRRWRRLLSRNPPSWPSRVRWRRIRWCPRRHLIRWARFKMMRGQQQWWKKRATWSASTISLRMIDMISSSRTDCRIWMRISVNLTTKSINSIYPLKVAILRRRRPI